MKKIAEVNANNFDKEVLQSNIPVLVDFWAEWCGPCRAIAPILEEVAEERSTAVKVTKVNIDENPDLANRYEIRSIPTLLIINRGEIQDQIIGLVQKHAILTKLNDIAQLDETKVSMV